MSLAQPLAADDVGFHCVSAGLHAGSLSGGNHRDQPTVPKDSRGRGIGK